MIELIAAYYSVPGNRTFCIYEGKAGKFTAAELVDGKWKTLKRENGKSLLIPYSHNLFQVEQDLKLFLFKNAPAAQKLNYVKKSQPFPELDKVKTPIVKFQEQ